MGFRVCDRLQNNGVFLVKRDDGDEDDDDDDEEEEEEGKEELRNEEGERRERKEGEPRRVGKIQCVYNVILEEREEVGENRWKENKRQRRKERREGEETRSGLRHRKRFHLEGWQHPRCPLREGGEERRARLSRHVGVRDAYKDAFMNRVFPGFDGSLAVELKTPFHVTSNCINSRLLYVCMCVHIPFFFFFQQR